MLDRDIISAGGDRMTTPRQKANNKYNLKAYKRFDARLRPELYQEFEDLREQLKLRSSYKSHVNKSWKDSYKKDKCKHKTKTITVQKDPTPKFFCSPEFEGEVAEIVKNYSERKVMVI